MKRDVHLRRDYPYPPELVWRLLTERELLAEWLMKNDFEPRIGHQFTLHTEPGPGFDGIVRAEVLELDPPRRMRWRWRGGPVDTTLTFRLEPRSVFARQGTRLHLDHEGFEGLPAVLVSFILQAGWARMLRSSVQDRLDAIAGSGQPAAVSGERETGAPRRALWYWFARLFAPILRRRR
jgi:uncharacterized protein YndB with AHSA1/START domain